MKKHSLLACYFTILTSLSLGMDLKEKEKPFSLYPPSEITLDDYANILIMGDSIDGWTDMSGNFGSWYQLSANNNRVMDSKGKTKTDITFLCLTPNPIVDNRRLRADYYFPAPKASFGSGPATLSLYHDTTLEELEAAVLLPQETASHLTQRILQWQNENYVMTVKPTADKTDETTSTPSPSNLSINLSILWEALTEVALATSPYFVTEAYHMGDNPMPPQPVYVEEEDLNSIIDHIDESTHETSNYSPEVRLTAKVFALYIFLITSPLYTSYVGFDAKAIAILFPS